MDSLMYAETSYLPMLSQDMTYISKLGSALDVLITCRKSSIEYKDVPGNLKKNVEEGLNLGITEVEKIESLFRKATSGQLNDSERLYLANLVRIFPFLTGNTLLSKNLLSVEGEGSIDSELYLKRLETVKSKFIEYLSNKKIKDFEFQEGKIDNLVSEMQNYLYHDYFQTVNSIEEFTEFVFV